jgi:hypothetical protein
MLALQRTAGNRATARLIARETKTRRLQRESGGGTTATAPPPGQTTAPEGGEGDAAANGPVGSRNTPAGLVDELHTAAQEGRWEDAARTLDQFDGRDLLATVRGDPEIAPYRRELMHGALEAGLPMMGERRSIASAILHFDPQAANLGRYDFVTEVRRDSDFRRVAVEAAVLDDDDFAEAMDELPDIAINLIRAGAAMSPVIERVITRIDRIPQRRVADRMDVFADVANPLRAKWFPSGPGKLPAGYPGIRPDGYRTDFAAWASADEEQPFAVGPDTTLNCWEMVMYAAYAAGELSWRWVHELYAAGGDDWWELLVGKLAPNDTEEYDRDDEEPLPARGDIVFFDGAEHVGLAVGNGTSDVYTFWPPPDVAVPTVDWKGKKFPKATPDRVKVFSIEAIARVRDWGEHECEVTFGKPPWA